MTTNSKFLLISIKPEFANKIVNGEKTIELRKVCPNVQNGDVIIIYSTSPVMAVIAVGKIENVLQEPPEIIWKKYHKKVGIDEKRYFEYFSNAKKAVGIEIKDINHFAKSIKLKTLKKKMPKFSPPQTYRYLSLAQVQEIMPNHSMLF